MSRSAVVMFYGKINKGQHSVYDNMLIQREIRGSIDHVEVGNKRVSETISRRVVVRT